MEQYTRAATSRWGMAVERAVTALAAPFSRDVYNHSRRTKDAPRAVCALCGREYDRFPGYRDHCSSACSGLAKQRKAKA